IQPVGNSVALAYYIAKYVSKDEPDTIGESIADAINRIQNEPNSDIGQKLFKAVMAIFRKRQVSACEAAQRLTGQLMKQASRKCVFVNTNKPEKRFKMVFVNEKGKNRVSMSILDRYIERPDLLEDMSLAEFAMKYDPLYNKKKGGDDD